MEVLIKDSKEEIEEIAAQRVAAYVCRHPQQILVFPTGNTPLGLFKNLADLVAKKQLSFQSSTLVELDDYLGIALEDERNLFQWLKRAFLDQVDFLEDHLVRFITDTQDVPNETKRIDQLLDARDGIGLLILGLGPNGHIGFNEPGSSFDSPTRAIQLSQASLLSSAGYWGNINVVPPTGLTLGLKQLSQAQETILLVNGKQKAEILRKTLMGEITPQIPATFLRSMQNVTVLADREAASCL